MQDTKRAFLSLMICVKIHLKFMSLGVFGQTDGRSTQSNAVKYINKVTP